MCIRDRSLLALLLAVARLPETRAANAGTADHRRGLLGLANTFGHLRRGPLAMILVAIFITTFGFAQFESCLSRLTELFGYNSRRNFLLFAYIGFILMLGQGFLVRRFLPKLGEYRMSLLGVVLMVVGFVLLALTAQETLPASSLWWLLPIITIGYSAVTPSLQSMLSQSASDDEQGAVLGSGQSLSSLARILGPAVGLTLLDRSAPCPSSWLLA